MIITAQSSSLTPTPIKVITVANIATLFILVLGANWAGFLILMDVSIVLAPSFAFGFLLGCLASYRKIFRACDLRFRRTLMLRCLAFASTAVMGILIGALTCTLSLLAALEHARWLGWSTLLGTVLLVPILVIAGRPIHKVPGTGAIESAPE